MKKDKKKSGIGKWIVTSGISLVLVIAMIVAFVMTTAYEGVINLALKTETTKVEADPNDKTDTEYFKSAYASVDEVRDAGMEIAEQLTDNGFFHSFHSLICLARGEICFCKQQITISGIKIMVWRRTSFLEDRFHDSEKRFVYVDRLVVFPTMIICHPKSCRIVFKGLKCIIDIAAQIRCGTLVIFHRFIHSCHIGIQCEICSNRKFLGFRCCPGVFSTLLQAQSCGSIMFFVDIQP